MAIEPTTGIGATIPQTSSQSALSQLGEDYTSFLKLLTAQIQNQDPLEPMDSTAFVSQLAQLSQVEQTIATNSNLEQISAQLATSTALSGVQLIGRDVALATDKIELENGQAKFEYELAAPAGLVSAIIKASDGTVVREMTGLVGTSDALHSVTWDGLDDSGLPVPDAIFTLTMEAKTTDGVAVSANTYSGSQVDGVSYDTGLPVFSLRNGDTAISAQIIGIR